MKNNSQIHEMVIASGRSSTRHTPMMTPEPDISNIELHVAGSSRKKRPMKGKDKPKKTRLEKPLSELTKEMTNIAIKDMEAWVNRPVEERHKEKRPDGSVKRPSNSFMLYRSAYTERCRELEKSKNHQDISSVAGASWAIETTEVKAQFDGWAKTERENHQRAFPDYKFQPQSQAAKDRKRKQKTEETSEEASDPEDPTYRNGRVGLQDQSRSTRAKKSRIAYRDYSDSPSFPSPDEIETPEPYVPIEGGTSYFPSINAVKPLPTAMDRMSQRPAYFVTNYPTAPGFELLPPYGTPPDSTEGVAYYSTTDHRTAMDYPSSSPPMGLPGISPDNLANGIPLEHGQVMLGSLNFLDPDLNTGEQGLETYHDNVGLSAQPSSSRSLGFRASDYFREGDGIPFLSGFNHEVGFGG